MLQKQYRLPSSEIKNVMRSGFRTRWEGQQMISLKNNLDISRFAFIVPINIDKRATVRNRIKRVLRESIRRQLDSFPKGKDVVIIARKS